MRPAVCCKWLFPLRGKAGLQFAMMRGSVLQHALKFGILQAHLDSRWTPVPCLWTEGGPCFNGSFLLAV